MRPRPFLLLALSLGGLAQAAPVRIEFWHAMGGVEGKVADYARDFNRSQSQYEVVPSTQGNYRELLPKLQAAIRAGNPPALAQLELTQVPALAAAGSLSDLSRLEDGLPAELTRDFYAPAWKSGEVGGKRYALPWNLSVPVMLYNAGALGRAGASAPATWSALETTSARLATNGRRPLVAAADAWTFEANVLSRGGSLVEGSAPALNSPEAVEALTQLARMARAGQAQPRSLNEATRAAFDFARGQNLFVLASVANWNDARKLPFFQLGMAPFPCEKAGACTVPLGGGALAVPRGVSAAQQAGAVAFWQYLMEPARQADWIKATAYAPPRRAVAPLLADWYAKNPQMRAAHTQMERAVPRPARPAYAAWTALVEDAVGQALSGKATARAALDEAQRRAK